MAKRQVRQRDPHECDTDHVVYGNPTKEQIQWWFQHDDSGEEWVVAAIERHLQSEEQRKGMFDRRLSIEKILNGRYTGDQEPFVRQTLKEWNEKLGVKVFSE